MRGARREEDENRRRFGDASDLLAAVHAAEFVPTVAEGVGWTSTEIDAATTEIPERPLRTARPSPPGRTLAQAAPRSGSVSDEAWLTAFLPVAYRQAFREDAALVATGAAGADHSVPFSVRHYHTLLPLEGVTPSAQAVVYKAVSAENLAPYALRRYVGPMHARSDNVVRALKAYHRVTHPNVVRLREGFTTRAFMEVSNAPTAASGNEMVFVYEYHPKANTLQHRHLSSHPSATPLDEHTLWGIAVQVLTAVRALHLVYHLSAFGLVTPRDILVTRFGRIQLNKIGIAAALDIDDEDVQLSRMQEHQAADLVACGMTLLALGARSDADAVQNGAVVRATRALEMVRATYSADVSQLILALISASGGWHEELDALLAPQVIGAYESCLEHADTLLERLRLEADESSLFHLCAKLCFVNERHDLLGDPQWSEVGDRYLLKLFRDRVFHGVDLDVARVKDELRRLDAGVNDTLLLTSRDGRSRLFVKYAEVRRCLEGALRELAARLSTQCGTVS
ncbi:hypothetical protein CDCA_CDCA01G0169 [Cyanidium caldarium]|uniref:Protein kinase domain-containing protein n=1 Tax=Cyanidium caldarium TaxID=2771 RepID=A0AAV9IPG2_CYACA|nr:hypothetical protein CDCA_CDCA01G0169 [Cyanidium caldarium]